MSPGIFEKKPRYNRGYRTQRVSPRQQEIR